MTRVPLKYVTSDVDRHGNPRWYFRKGGKPKIRLRGLPVSEEFMAAYKAALAGYSPPQRPRRSSKSLAGTLRWLCEEYSRSAPFHELAPRTRYVRRRELERVCTTAGDLPLSDLTASAIRKGMDRRAETPEA